MRQDQEIISARFAELPAPPVSIGLARHSVCPSARLPVHPSVWRQLHYAAGTLHPTGSRSSTIFLVPFQNFSAAELRLGT